MPVYEAECMKCHKRIDYIRPVAQYLDTPMCCDQQTEKRIFSAPSAISDIEPYESPVTGKMITSRSERREDFKASGCREWEGMDVERKEAQKRKAAEDAVQDQKLETEVQKVWAQLPEDKKTQAIAVMDAVQSA